MKMMDSNYGQSGKLTLQVVTMPRDTNASGDIYAGWLIEKMDLAAATLAAQISKGRAATVAMERVEFLSPVSLGDLVSCFTELVDTGRSSMKIRVEVYTCDASGVKTKKVTEAIFTYVAITEIGGIRQIPSGD